MKKAGSLIFALFLTFFSRAQVSAFEIGFEAGPSLAWLRGNAIIEQHSDPRLSGEGGLVLQYNINKIFSVRIVPGFARKGARTRYDLTDATGMVMGTVDLFTNLDYCTLPMLFRASMGDKIKGFVNAGPYMNALFNSGISRPGENDPGLSASLAKMKSFDFGIACGLGLLVPLGKKCNFTLEGRHNIGLYNISDAMVINNGSIKTNSFVILLGCAWQVSE